MTDINQTPECCPKFDPAPWDGKTFEWKNKRFIKSKVFTFFYMPVNLGSSIRKAMELVEKANAKMPDYLCLSDHTSFFNMDNYLAVDKEVPGTENVQLTGKFLSKVYEGDFKNTGDWCKDFANFVKEKGMEMKKMYMWYTTCPECAKKYGKNYTVIIAEVK